MAGSGERLLQLFSTEVMLEDFRLCDITEDAAITMSGMVMSCGSDTYHPTQPEPILSPTETVKKKKKNVEM